MNCNCKVRTRHAEWCGASADAPTVNERDLLVPGDQLDLKIKGPKGTEKITILVTNYRIMIQTKGHLPKFTRVNRTLAMTKEPDDVYVCELSIT